MIAARPIKDIHIPMQIVASLWGSTTRLIYDAATRSSFFATKLKTRNLSDKAIGWLNHGYWMSIGNPPGAAGHPQRGAQLLVQDMADLKLKGKLQGGFIFG